MILLHLFLYKTPLGLAIRAVGENKNAAESVGISSRKIKYIALILSGVLASMGGFYLSGGYMNMFTKDMSGGRALLHWLHPVWVVILLLEVSWYPYFLALPRQLQMLMSADFTDAL